MLRKDVFAFYVLKQDFTYLELLIKSFSKEHTLLQSMPFLTINGQYLAPFDQLDMSNDPHVAEKQLSPSSNVPIELWPSLYHKEMVEELDTSSYPACNVAIRRLFLI